MAKIDELVKDFLAQKKIAVVGVSDKRDTGCNLGYKKFKESGYQVFAVNPRIRTFDGDPCYPDLKSLPEKPEAVFILTNPKVTEVGDYIFRVCFIDPFQGAVLLAANMSSVSPEAVRLCRENGIAVIPGSCPNQFLKPDGAHGMMRGLWRLFGFLRVESN